MICARLAADADRQNSIRYGSLPDAAIPAEEGIADKGGEEDQGQAV